MKNRTPSETVRELWVSRVESKFGVRLYVSIYLLKSSTLANLFEIWIQQIEHLLSVYTIYILFQAIIMYVTNHTNTGLSGNFLVLRYVNPLQYKI